jgi:hypothetical protein
MKIKFLAVFCLAVLSLMVGCKSATNTNVNTTNANMNTNANMTMAVADPATEAAVKAALAKKGLNDVTVQATTTEITIRGTVPKGKLGEAMMAASEAGRNRKVTNQVTEK